jgi:alpha-beta hydrolase superfamily lysophospholipase
MEHKHLVIAVHGIRDFGQWQDRLGQILNHIKAELVFERYRFGYFSVIAFLVPFARWLAAVAFRRRLRKLIEANPEARFSFVAHSFGTYIVAHALRSMKASEFPHIDTIILAGSVLRSSFNWPALVDRSQRDGKGIHQVINDCGWDDNILILSQLFVLFTGMAGRVGVA